eukprot:1196241-Prorocentrum_minimum.AAC.1
MRKSGVFSGTLTAVLESGERKPTELHDKNNPDVIPYPHAHTGLANVLLLRGALDIHEDYSELREHTQLHLCVPLTISIAWTCTKSDVDPLKLRERQPQEILIAHGGWVNVQIDSAYLLSIIGNEVMKRAENTTGIHYSSLLTCRNQLVSPLSDWIRVAIESLLELLWGADENVRYNVSEALEALPGLETGLNTLELLRELFGSHTIDHNHSPLVVGVRATPLNQSCSGRLGCVDVRGDKLGVIVARAGQITQKLMLLGLGVKLPYIRIPFRSPEGERGV